MFFRISLPQRLTTPDVSKLTVIKEQVPEISWEHLRLMVAMLKVKYGANSEDDEIPDRGHEAKAVQQKLTAVRDGEPEAAPDTTVKPSSSKQLPEWLKRPPSDPDLKTLAERPSSQTATQAKKKPKLGI